MAQKENIYRVGFGRIRLGYDQDVTASEGLTPEQVNNMIAAQIPNITFNDGGGNVPFATLNGQTYYFPPTPKTYDSVYPIKRTPGQLTDTFSLMYDADTLGVRDNKLYAKAKPVTYELPLKEENNVVKVVVGNSMTKASGSLNVKVSENDKLLSVDGNGLKTTISIDGPNDVNNYRVYTIKGKANVTIGTISFPIYDFTDTKINTLSFDTSTKKLTITDTTGSTFETTVPYKDYVQGDGININGSTVSVKYDGTTIVKDATTGNLKSVFSVLNDAPIIVSNGNTVGLNYNSNQFEVSEGALNIKDGVIPDLSNLESSVTTIQGNITTMNAALANKANVADLSSKLDIAQPNVTAGYYPVVRMVNGEKRITFEEFPILDEDIEKLQKLDSVLVYKGTKSSISELPAIAESEVGDVWFVNIGTQNDPKYAEYASNGTVWEKLGDHEPIIYTAGTGININSNNEISCTVQPDYTGSNGIIVDNVNREIKLDDSVFEEPTDNPVSNYYTYNGIQVTVPQGRGYIYLRNNYNMPQGANPSVYKAGVYVEDETIDVDSENLKIRAYTLHFKDRPYIIDESQYLPSLWEWNNATGFYMRPEYNYSNTTGLRPYGIRIILNHHGSITNHNDGYLSNVMKLGDFAYDNYGNLYRVSNIADNSQNFSLTFNLLKQASPTRGEFYYADPDYPSAKKWDATNFSTLNWTKGSSSSYNYNAYSLESDGNGGYNHIYTLYSNAENNVNYPLPNDENYNLDGFISSNGTTFNLYDVLSNYYVEYTFRGAYRNPVDNNVFYVYGTTDDNIALCCYMREMIENGVAHMRPAFAGFLTFGTPYSLERPIERRQEDTNVTAFSWTEARPEIMFISASEIQNDLNNIDTTNFQTNDIVCITNPGSTLTFGTGNNAVTLYNIPFEPQFRWTGTEFKPMFYFIN